LSNGCCGGGGGGGGGGGVGGGQLQLEHCGGTSEYFPAALFALSLLLVLDV
jgi:hypothetical protein